MFAALLICPVILFKEIGKKEQLQDEENDKQFDKQNCPDSFAPPRHCGEAFIVEPEYPFKQRNE
jgi:hypothetical protein